MQATAPQEHTLRRTTLVLCLVIFLEVAATCALVQDARPYLVGILSHTLTLLAGCGATVTLGLTQKYLLKKPLPAQWEITIMLSFVFFAGFQTWQDQLKKVHDADSATRLEQSKTQDLEKRLAALEQPALRLVMDQNGVGRLTMDNGKTFYLVGFATAHVTNAGSPSIAEGWSMEAVLTDGRVFRANAMYMNPNYPAHLSPLVGGERTIAQSDALYLKTMKPIERGMLVRGILAFPFSRFDQKLFQDMQRAGTRFVLRCNDVNGKEVVAENTFTGVPQSLDYYPGVLPVPAK